MKKCSRCGGENPNEAPCCQECGTAFEAIKPSAISPEGRNEGKRPLTPKHWLLRILIAICIWIIITAISLHVAWQQASHAELAWIQKLITQNKLSVISNAISAYQEQFHVPPTNLEQLLMVTNQEFVNTNDLSKELLVDGWQHPFVLMEEGTNSVAVSYGQDGKRGGIGIDSDLTSTNPNPKGTTPTFAQFWANKECQGTIITSITCGGLAALLSFLTVKIPDLKPKGIVILLLTLGATIIGTLWTAATITVLHIPNGH